jgi:hypothetical protein
LTEAARIDPVSVVNYLLLDRAGLIQSTRADRGRVAIEAT